MPDYLERGRKFPFCLKQTGIIPVVASTRIDSFFIDIFNSLVTINIS